MYQHEGHVPEEMYTVPIGQGVIRREGGDVTIVALSYLVPEAMKAADDLVRKGIAAEVIDPRTSKPLDRDLILASVIKTGRLVVADVGWKSFGVAAEISALVAEEALGYLKKPIVRVALPDCPAPASSALEKVYYPTVESIIEAVQKVMNY